MPTIEDLEGMSLVDFVGALGGVFERSPWVAERTWPARPFGDVETLHRAMTDVVRRAAPEERLALLRAHPDLAGKVARAGELTASSRAEQSSAGLDRLTDGEHERFQGLNAAYRERYGFPFIIAVRRHTKASILSAFESRLTNSREREIETALGEVYTITRLRLDALVQER